MFNFKIYLQILFLALLYGNSAQVIAQQKQIVEQQARNELDKRGISEDELKAKLAEKGINLDDLKSMSPEQALQMQSTIEAAIKEIEAEKASSNSKGNAAANSNKSVKVTNSKIENAKENKPIDAKLGGVEKDPVLEEGKEPVVTEPTAIWGQNIFRNKSLALFRQTNDIKPPDSYILGIGDQVTVAIWGMSQLNETYEINADGYIAPDRMPRIFLKGVTIGKAKPMLKNYFKRFYRFGDNDFQVSLNYSRNINVNIFGEVYQYGGFTIPAINTAFNALIAAGGPTNIGSVRKVKLIRNGVERRIDVYKFMANPTIDQDFYLENNDVIQVPVAELTVTIAGAINRPFQYELIETEGLKKLIEYAGGLTPDAIQKTVQVERFQNDKRISLDVPYSDLISKGGDFKLEKGDIVTIYRVKTSSENFVFVKGEVRAEANFQYNETMRISDLVKKVQFTENSNLKNAFIIRTNPDNTVGLLRVNVEKILQGDLSENLLLQPKDELKIYRLEYFTNKSYINVKGAVKNPNKFDYDADKNMRIKDIVTYCGGLRPEAWMYAYLFRKKPGINNEVNVVRVNIVDAMTKVGSDQNLALEAFDSLVVVSEGDFTEAMQIEILGAVQKPGKFQYSKGLTVKDAISLSGGFNYSASSNRIEIFRIIIKDNQPTQTIVKAINISKALNEFDATSNYQIEPFDIIVVRNQPEFEFQKIVNLSGEIKYPGPYALISSNETIADLIERAGGLSAEAFAAGATLNRNQDNIGFVVLDLPQALQRKNSRYNFILKEGDDIFIPKQKDLVSISGATNAADLYPNKLIASNNTINVAYYERKNAIFYIDKYAAGLSKNADRNKITVEHPNGKISRTKHYLFFKIYPKVTKGSVVNVGYKEVKTAKQKKEGKEVDWEKIVSSSLAQITAVLSLYLLIDRID